MWLRADLRRVLVGLTQVGLVLPFVTVEDCATHRTETFTGAAFLAANPGPFPLLPILLAVGLLAWPVSAKVARDDALRAAAAGLSLVCLLLLVGVGLGNTHPELGFWVDTAAWSLAWLTFARTSFAAPVAGTGDPSFALVAWGPAVLGVAANPDNLQDAALAAVVTALVATPLTRFGLVCSRTGDTFAMRIAWGLAAAAYLGLTFVAVTGDEPASALVAGLLGVFAAVRVVVRPAG